MALDLILRFFIGGAIVCAFSAISSVLKPKSFAGIFGAAPSVALATLGLTLAAKPAHDASLEGRSMLVGAAALFAYCVLVSTLFLRTGHHAIVEATVPWLLWFAVAFSLWWVLLR